MIYRNHIVLDEILPDNFQKNIKISVGENVVCSGRLILFKHKTYYYQLLISKEKGKKVNVLIPYPFAVELRDDNSILFDYRNETLAEGDKNIINSINRMRKPSKSIFYNSIAKLTIQ